MTEWTNAPLDEIRGLVEERSRYESWLEALEGRRGSTPTHVFDRVQLDYRGRLARVMESLGGHVPALREATAGYERRHDASSRQLAERHDELAEAELRMLVGEYAPEEGERRRQEAAQDIQRLEAERDEVAARLADVRDLLGRAHTEPSAAAPANEAPVAEPAGDAVGAQAEGSARSDTRSDAPVPTAAVAGADAPSSVGDPDGPTFAGGSAEHFAPPLRAPQGAMTGAERAITPAGFPAAAPRAASSFAPDVGPLVTPATGFAVQTGSEGGPQQKTLRCEECGEMNLPTEWYCERCGGELASL